jgi:hypothetical protein
MLKMNKVILILIFFSAIGFTQNFKVEKVKGIVKLLEGTSEEWVDVNEKNTLTENTVIMTGKNSSVSLRRGDIEFVLKGSSAISLSGLKKISLDDLLLALAMEDMLNAPKNKNENKSSSTAVYGTKTGSSKETNIDAGDDFGIKRLNGAMQLAEGGFKESALISAKQTYRKYPATKEMSRYRIYFADLLTQCGLYEEAYNEYNQIKALPLTGSEKAGVENKLNLISSKLINH